MKANPVHSTRKRTSRQFKGYVGFWPRAVDCHRLALHLSIRDGLLRRPSFRPDRPRGSRVWRTDVRMVSGTLRMGEPTPQAATPLARAYSAEPTNVSIAYWLAASNSPTDCTSPNSPIRGAKNPDRDRNSRAVAMMTAYDPFLSHSRPAGIGKLDPAIVLLLATGSQRPWLGIRMRRVSCHCVS